MIDKLKKLILEKQQQPAPAKPAFKPRPEGNYNKRASFLVVDF